METHVQDLDHGSLLSRDEQRLDAGRKVLETKFVEDVASFVAWMAHPYAVSFFVVFFGTNMVLGSPSPDATVNAFRGLGFAVTVYLLVCSWQLRDSLLVRPHPVFWRVVKGLALLYLFGLVWLAFQNVGDARRLLAFWDPALGVPLEERSYASKCDVFTPSDPVSRFRNVYDALFEEDGGFDTFILCHVLGWFCKMLMIRDLRLTLVASVLFEIYEVTFAHMLPNFAECWWDSLILDIVVCNGLGILCGYWWLRFWRCADYNFLYDVDVVGEDGRVVRRWKPLVAFRHLVAPIVLLVLLAAIELNAFFLKFILWVPPPHELNLYRVVFWWLLGCAGTRELYYKFNAPDSASAPVGMMLALIFANAAVELLICVKMGVGMFPAPFPTWIRNAWVLALGALVVFAAVYFPMRAATSKEVEVATSASIEAEGAAPPAGTSRGKKKKAL